MGYRPRVFSDAPMNNLDRYLFRGISIDTKEWVYGSLVSNSDKAVIVVTGKNSDSQSEDEPECEGYYPIIPETVGQWTGLVDKNGEKIFEGDNLFVIDFADDYFEGVIVWDKNDGSFVLNDDAGNYLRRLDFSTEDELSIMSSIHDDVIIDGMLKGLQQGKQ